MIHLIGRLSEIFLQNWKYSLIPETHRNENKLVSKFPTQKYWRENYTKGWFEFVFFFGCVANSSHNKTLEFPPVCSPLPLWENWEKSICFLHNHITSHYLRNVKCKPQQPTISIFSLFSKFNFSSSYEKEKGKCMQNIILLQAIADFNKTLYKTGGCILFIADYILDLESYVSFLWLGLRFRKWGIEAVASRT